mmetsp:Transcript_12218/g.23725  ORF Transcript_12218/g.23725 Transcript_12218/m.23725 type:complete len:598 (+) Transcript_12218:50-1843(+)
MVNQVAFMLFINLHLLSVHADRGLRATKQSKADEEANIAIDLLMQRTGDRTSADGSNRSALAQRLIGLMQPMANMYRALPKNKAGLLDHDALRYALHRSLAHRRGWFIRGLEPEGAEGAEVGGGEVPDYLQAVEKNEVSLHKDGTSLTGLASLTAAFEDEGIKEATDKMKAILLMYGLPSQGKVPSSVLRSVTDTFFMDFVLTGSFPAKTVEDAERFKAAKWGKTAERDDPWWRSLQDRLITTDPDGQADVDLAMKTATEVPLAYQGALLNTCQELKSTLTGLEGNTPGRVRLPAFYRQGLAGRWSFSERPEYLRSLGALDETNPEQPLVITTNYILSRTNCFQASPLYAVCCPVECWDLMGKLEEQFQAPTANASRLAEVIEQLASSTVEAPHKLSEAVRRRLDDVAVANDGVVPLHGRLFAQWMHHVYPRECPYPHEAGTVVQQTPEAWTRESGHTHASASKAELEAHVEGDGCSATVGPQGPCDDSVKRELPWKGTEELLVGLRPRAQKDRQDHWIEQSQQDLEQDVEHDAHPHNATSPRSGTGAALLAATGAFSGCIFFLLKRIMEAKSFVQSTESTEKANKLVQSTEEVKVP